MANLFRRMAQSLLIWIIKFYQYLISPVLGNHCRFYPSCSHYAVESINTLGPVKGVVLAAKRLGKCHPWHPGGIDLVPELNSQENN